MQDEPDRLILKLEGKMVGPWVTECRQAWVALRSSLSGKKLTLDLCAVMFVDESGLELLRQIYRTTHADMITDSPLTKYFADQAARSKSLRKQGE